MTTRLELAQKALQEAEYILIGGGAGFIYRRRVIV